MAGGRSGSGRHPLEQAGLDAVEFLGADHAFVSEADELPQFLPEAFRRQPGAGVGGLGVQGERTCQGQGRGRPDGEAAWVRRWAPA